MENIIILTILFTFGMWVAVFQDVFVEKIKNIIQWIIKYFPEENDDQEE